VEPSDLRKRGAGGVRTDDLTDLVSADLAGSPVISDHALSQLSVVTGDRV
jgi:hypothetical protein